MRALVYTDVQATDGHERCFVDPTVPLQVWRVQRMYAELTRIYREYDCEALWDLGDLTDDRTAIPVPVIDQLCDCLEPFDGEHNLKLVGNHEQWLRATTVHVGKMFRRFFKVVDKTATIPVKKVNIICASYNDDETEIVDYLRRCPRDIPSILLGHFQVAGCQMSSGVAATGVMLKDIQFVKLGLLGHIHKPQSLNENIHYVGSPFQQHWGEAGEQKRVAIVDTESQSVTWVPMEGFPIYQTVEFLDFTEKVKQKSEDRYKVILRSVQDAERFYAHPLANRADETILAYDQVEASQEIQDDLPQSKQDIMAAYLKKNPPPEALMDEKSMLEIGEDITELK